MEPLSRYKKAQGGADQDLASKMPASRGRPKLLLLAGEAIRGAAEEYKRLIESSRDSRPSTRAWMHRQRLPADQAATAHSDRASGCP